MVEMPANCSLSPKAAVNQKCGGMSKERRSMAEQNEEKLKKGKPKRLVTKQQYARMVAIRTLITVMACLPCLTTHFIPHHLQFLAGCIVVFSIIGNFWIRINYNFSFR